MLLPYIAHRNRFSRLYQKDKSSASKVKFRQASNHCKRVLEAAKRAYANKTKESITSQKLGSRDFWRTANSVLSKGKSAIHPLLNDPEVLSSASDKAKLFAENFSLNSNLDDSGVSLPVFPSRTNLKLHIISVSPKMVKKVIMNLDLSKATGPDCIPVVVLKNCGPDLSQSYLIELLELLGLLTDLGLLALWHLTYRSILTGFGMLVFFTKVSLMEFQVRYLALFLLFSVIDGFEWFWMESLHKNIQLMQLMLMLSLLLKLPPRKLELLFVL